MDDKTLKVLGGTAGVLVLASIWVGLDAPTVEFEFTPGRSMFKDIDVARIAKIQIGVGDDKVEMTRRGKDFVVDTKMSYPASNREINILFRTLLQIRLQEEVTSDPANHKELGVTEASEEAKVVKFYDDTGAVVTGIIVGKDIGVDTPQGNRGRYIRQVGEDSVFRTTDYITYDLDSARYVDKNLLKIVREDVAKVEVTRKGGQSYSIVYPDDGEITLENVPEKKRPKGTTYETVFGAATNLSFTDLMPAGDAKDLEFNDTHTVHMRNKAVYEFAVAKKLQEKENEDDEDVFDYYLKATARFDGKRPTQSQVANADDAELKKVEAQLLAFDAVKEFVNKHQSWVYQVSSWQAQNLTKGWSQLIEDADKPEEIEVSHILIAYQGADRADPSIERTKEEAFDKAKQMIEEVTNDLDSFADVAEKESDGPSATEGGALGAFKADGTIVGEGGGSMDPAFTEAAFKLEVGEVTLTPVETPFGYHVIKRTK